MKSTIEAAPFSESTAIPSPEEQRSLVQRIIASQPFRRSARLRDFLLYVAGESLRDPHAELNEQEIGEKVFGRAASYNRSQDNIVRVNATELRRRIDQYFAEEGVDETIVIEIPRGGYKPVFRYRSVAPLPQLVAVAEPVPAAPIEPAPVLEVSTASIQVSAASTSPGWYYWIWAAGTAALVLLCIFFWQQNRALREDARASGSGPTLKAFWHSFAQNHQAVDIVLPDDSASVVEDITHQSITLQDYFRSAYVNNIAATRLSADRKMDVDEIASHDLITFGDMKAAHRVMENVPVAAAAHFTLARYYTADAMKQNNVILIGGQKANPWVRLLDDRMNFIVDYDYAEGHGTVLNMHPRPGEPAVYTVPASPNGLTGYGVVSYLPSPSQHGRALVVAGMDADSTSAAADFITSENQMDRFKQMLKTKELPYFEVLLRISRVKGTSFSSEIVAYRTYPDLR